MIGLLFTGGTISMKLDPAVGAAVPAFGAADLMAQVPDLGAIADFEVEDFSRLPGPHVTPEQMWRLAKSGETIGNRTEFDGFRTRSYDERNAILAQLSPWLRPGICRRSGCGWQAGS